MFERDSPAGEPLCYSTGLDGWLALAALVPILLGRWRVCFDLFFLWDGRCKLGVGGDYSHAQSLVFCLDLGDELEAPLIFRDLARRLHY